MVKNTSSNPIIDVDYNSSKAIMEKLLASQEKKLISLYRGQQVEGEVITKSDKEIILDVGAKSEGILKSGDLSQNQLDELKIGDKLKTFVSQVENESGQVILSLNHPAPLQPRGFSRGSKINWSKFIQAQNQNTKLKGKVLEINKGGLIVEVDAIRGFLPNSQVGYDALSKAGTGMEGLLDKDILVSVIEIDSENNRLIFSQRGQVSEDIKTQLKNFKPSQDIKGKIVTILPFGLIVDISGIEGIVFISDVAWEKIDDLTSKFSVNQEIEAKVLGLDEDLGRLNLSLKHLTEDPFDKLTKDYKEDEVVKGEVSEIDSNGVIVKLKDGVEGFIPSSKIGSTQFEVGKSITLLVDSVDKNRRRVNLAPMITSTAGLIYK